MPTLKQKKAAEIVLNNPEMLLDGNKKKLLEEVSYSKGITEQPSRVLESKGFKEALADLGLTEELIATSLVSDIKAKEKNRLGELRLGAEILGMKKIEPEALKPTGVQNYNFIFSAETQASVKEIEAKIKARLIQPNVQTT